MALPATASDSNAIPALPFDTLNANRNAAAMAAVPADRPSMLSSRLNALVMPTIHRSVTATFIQWKGRKDVVTPAAIRTTAASTCPSALAHTGNRSRQMSSARPMAKTRLAPPSSATSLSPTR